MIHTKFQSALVAAAIALPSQLFAFTDAELCEAVFREYGVRSEACNASAEDAEVGVGAQTVNEISPDQRDNHIFFLNGGSSLDPVEQNQIALLATVLNTTPMRATCLHLVGHSDSSGAAGANLVLSEKRAEVVANELRSRLLDRNRVIQVSGVGEAEPLTGFSGSSKFNRRVTILARTCRS